MNKTLENKELIVERVRFGDSWNKSMSFDLKLDNFCVQCETKNPYLPWSIAHVQEQLGSHYQINIKDALNLLSNGPIQTLFYKYWLKKYSQNDENPALIPELCGFRKKFYYYKFKDQIYSSRDEIVKRYKKDKILPINFRFDFFAYNAKKEKAILIDLDETESNKSDLQQFIDEMKDKEAKQLKIPVIIFTATKIEENIESCFLLIDDVLNN